MSHNQWSHIYHTFTLRSVNHDEMGNCHALFSHRDNTTLVGTRSDHIFELDLTNKGKILRKVKTDEGGVTLFRTTPSNSRYLYTGMIHHWLVWLIINDSFKPMVMAMSTVVILIVFKFNINWVVTVEHWLTSTFVLIY